MLNQEQMKQGQATVRGIQKTLESFSLGHGLFQKDLRAQGGRGRVAVLISPICPSAGSYAVISVVSCVADSSIKHRPALLFRAHGDFQGTYLT